MPIESRPFVVLGFRTTHEALAAESALMSSGVDVVPIPPPHSLGSLCGIAMRIPPEQEPKALLALTQAGIEPQMRAQIEDRITLP